MRRTVLLRTGLAVLGGPPAAQAACSDADIVVGSGNLAKADDALLCLVNEYRVRSGLGGLGFDRTLRTSPGHNRNMLGSDYRSAAMGFAAGVPVAGFGGRGATVTQLFSTAAARKLKRAREALADCRAV